MTPVTRLQMARNDRARSDYVFSGPGLNIFLTIITCGIFGFFLFYQLMRRDKEHNERRLEFLDAANAYAWEQANSRGLADALRPAFERVAAALEPLRRMTHDFRDPTVWLILDILVGGLRFAGLGAGIGEIIGFILIDMDLDTHDRAEGSAEAELASIYARLGISLPAPDPGRVKGRHNYVARVIVSILTCGVYTLWWLYDMQVEGNRHVEGNWAFEDALVAAI
jgi:hypothetical protein